MQTLDAVALPPPLPPKEKRPAKSWQPVCETDAHHRVQKTVVEPLATQSSPVPQPISEDALWALDDLQKTLGLKDKFDEQFQADGKYERFYESRERLVWYPNGTVKEAYPDGRQIVYFTNGDKKKVSLKFLFFFF